jgi:hypothetical protein
MNVWLLLLLLSVHSSMFLCKQSSSLHAAAVPRKLHVSAAGRAAAAVNESTAHVPVHNRQQARRECSSRQEAFQAVLDAVARPVSAAPLVQQQLCTMRWISNICDSCH